MSPTNEEGKRKVVRKKKDDVKMNLGEDLRLDQVVEFVNKVLIGKFLKDTFQ